MPPKYAITLRMRSLHKAGLINNCHLVYRTSRLALLTSKCNLTPQANVAFQIFSKTVHFTLALVVSQITSSLTTTKKLRLQLIISSGLTHT